MVVLVNPIRSVKAKSFEVTSVPRTEVPNDMSRGSCNEKNATIMLARVLLGVPIAADFLYLTIVGSCWESFSVFLRIVVVKRLYLKN